MRIAVFFLKNLISLSFLKGIKFLALEILYKSDFQTLSVVFHGYLDARKMTQSAGQCSVIAPFTSNDFAFAVFEGLNKKRL